jgi:hypothetical protein
VAHVGGYTPAAGILRRLEEVTGDLNRPDAVIMIFPGGPMRSS